MRLKVIIVDEDATAVKYPIRPQDIDVNKFFYSAFGYAEIEVLANYLVRFFQKLDGWKAFKKKDLEKFYLENGGEDERLFENKGKFPFHWLDKELLVRGWDWKYRVTNYFIIRCHKSSPTKR